LDDLPTDTFQLSGNIVLSSLSEGSVQFLRHEFIFWDKSTCDVLHSGDADANGMEKKQNDGRFVAGQYSFPFSFPFPTEADPITKSSPQSITRSSTSLNDHTPKKEKRKLWRSRFTSSSVPNSGTGEASSSSQMETSTPSPPSHTLLQARNSFVTSPLPQSFMEKGINLNVGYDISVHIVHGRFKASNRQVCHIWQARFRLKFLKG
jgi:hypothetical protein